MNLALDTEALFCTNVVADVCSTIVFYDGTEITKEWKSTAKQDCWTDEYKDRQREWVRNYMAKGDGRFSPFTTRIKCGCCGGSCRRQVQGSSDGKIAYWRCSGGSATNCGIKGIREPELMEIAAGLMGIPEFDGDAFREQVDHITMVKSGLLDFATSYADGRLTFTFKNGSTFEG